MSTVTVDRPVGWVNALRRFKVMVNGEERARIRNGETIEIDVDPDVLVRIVIRLDWTGSNTWEGAVKDGETVHLQVTFDELFRGMFSRDRWLLLRRVDDSSGV